LHSPQVPESLQPWNRQTLISVPLGFFGGIGAASKIGVLVKGSNYLEAVAEMTTIVFDKTGTLTKGEFKVTDVITENSSKEELIELAALGEGYSNHPIANSIREAYGKELDLNRVTNTEEIAGHGIKAVIDGKTPALFRKLHGWNLRLDDWNSPLPMLQVRSVPLWNKEAAETVAQALGIDEVHAELLPGGKVEQVEALLKAEKEKERLLLGIQIMLGITERNIGIAMGKQWVSDAASKAAVYCPDWM